VRQADSGSGICGACCTSLFGMGIFVSMLGVLGWNEQSSVCSSRALAAAEEAVEAVDCDARPEMNKGSLVHFDCPLARESLPEWTPGSFGIDGAAEAFRVSAVRVTQTVEMLQCKEEVETHKRKQGDKVIETKTYTYTKEWSDREVESNGFKAWSVDDAWQALSRGCGGDFKGNRPFPVRSAQRHAQRLVAGNFDVTRHVGRVAADTPIDFLSSWHGWRFQLGGETATVARSAIYCGCRPEEPDIGCARVTYRRSSAARVSHLAEAGADGGTRPWAAPGSWMCSPRGQSSSVDLFREGSSGAAELVRAAQGTNAVMTWLIRVLGVLFAVFGVRLSLYPVEALAQALDGTLSWFRSVPIAGPMLDFAGDVIRGAVGCAVSLIALGIAVPASLAVITVMQAAMRPFIAVPVLVGCVAALCVTAAQMRTFAREGQKMKTA